MNRDEIYQGISMEDVWGTFSESPSKRLTNGMLVAQGLPYKENSPEALKIQNNSDDSPLPQRCPIWNDLLPYKSVTVVCDEKDLNATTRWLSYVHGGSHSNLKNLPDGKVAIRSDYQAW
jgi:hypothetical protein